VIGRTVWRWLAMALLFVTLWPGQAAAAEPVRIRAGIHDEYTRIVFDWASRVDYEARLEDGALVVEFSRDAEFDAEPARLILGPLIGRPETADDGRRVTIPLKKDYELKHFRVAERIVIDLLAVAPKPEPASESESESTQVVQPSETAEPDPVLRPGPDSPPIASDGASEERPQAQASAEPPAAAAVKAPIALLPVAETPMERPPHPPARSPVQRAAAPEPEAPQPDTSEPDASEPDASEPDASETTVEGPEEAPAAGQATRASDDTGAATAAETEPGRGKLEITRLAAEEPGQLLPLGRSPDRFDPVQLRLTWQSRPAAAAFRYGDELWLVFDAILEAGAAERIGTADMGFAAARQLDSGNGTALVIAAMPGLAVRLFEEEHGWIADIRPRSPLPEYNLDYKLVEARATGKLMRFASEHAGRIQWFSDPNTMERLVVVPLREVGRGLSMSANHPQFEMLQSQQGLVLHPLNEGLEIAVTENGVLLRHRDGLLVSSNDTRSRMPLDRSADDLGPRLFSMVRWRRGPQEDFVENEQALIGEVIVAQGSDLPAAHLELARFYFAWGLATETLGLLNVVETEAPRLAEDPEVKLMRAVSAFHIEDYRTAGRLLADSALSGEREAVLWRAAYAAKTQDWQVAANGFALAEPLIFTYPSHVRNDLLLWGAEARLGVGDTGGASEYLVALMRRELSKSDEARAKYLSGRRFYLDGDEELAVKLWRELANDSHQATQARARLGLLEIGLARGELSDDEAIAELERLRFAWRGDDFERALLLLLAELYEADGRYRDALVGLRQVATRFADAGQSDNIGRRMQALFSRLFLTPAGETVAPLESLAIYEEFKELTPGGEEGERIVTRLADRLVEIDLLDRAAVLLDRQVRYRLEGEEKARGGARLALVHLLNRDPQAGLEALELSEQEALPEVLRQERALLRARALAKLDRYQEALDTLGGDESGRAVELRAEIYWRIKDWRPAIAALKRLIPVEPPARALSEAEAGRVMNLAVALTMSDDRLGLVELFEHYGDAMAGTQHRAAFRLLAGDAENDSFSSIAEGLEQVDRVQDFYQNYGGAL